MEPFPYPSRPRRSDRKRAEHAGRRLATGQDLTEGLAALGLAGLLVAGTRWLQTRGHLTAFPDLHVTAGGLVVAVVLLAGVRRLAWRSAAPVEEAPPGPPPATGPEPPAAEVGGGHEEPAERPAEPPPPVATAVPAPGPAPAPAGREPAPVPWDQPLPRRVAVSQRRTLLGLDLGTWRWRFVQVLPGAEGPTIVNAGEARAVARGPGNGADVRYAAGLRSFLGAFGVAQRRVVAALGGHGVLVRIVEFPPMSEPEVREAVRVEWDRYVPLPQEGTVHDLAVLGDGPARGAARVLLVAAPREAVLDTRRQLRQARLDLSALEVRTVALYRAVAANGYAPENDEAGALVTVDLGAGATEVAVFAHGFPVLQRVLQPGGLTLVQRVAGALGTDPAAAEAGLRRDGLRGEAGWVLRAELENLFLLVAQTVEFCLDRHAVPGVARVVLTGGVAGLLGLPELATEIITRELARRVGQESTEVVVGRPTRRVPLHPDLASSRPPMGPEFMLALGLALREAPPQ